MKTARGAAVVLAVAGAWAGAGSAVCGGDFFSVLKDTQDAFNNRKKDAAEIFKSGKPPDKAVASIWTTAQGATISVFGLCCSVYGRISFSDASHYATPKSLKAWQLYEAGPDGQADGPPGAVTRFYATWSVKEGADAADIAVTFCELPQRVYESGALGERTTKFEGVKREVKNAQVADVLQALADDFARVMPGAVLQKPAKKSVGVARWAASATAKTADGAAVRRDWYAWETQGVLWTVQGTTWVATAAFSPAAAADPACASRTDELLKGITKVID